MNLGRRTLILLSILTVLVSSLVLLTMPTLADTPDTAPPLPRQDRLPAYTDGGSPTQASVSSSTQGELKTFYAVADAEVREADPTGTYGISPIMGAGYSNYTEHDLIRRALLRFDVVTYLPPGTVIHQATLRLYLSGYCDAQTTSYRAYRLSTNWSETSVSWQTQPAMAEAYGSVAIPMVFGSYTIDVRDLVQAWTDGTVPDFGIMIQGPESPDYACAFREFYTKGGGGYDKAPELVVDYSLPVPALAASHDEFLFERQCDGSAPAPQILDLQSNLNELRDWTATIDGEIDWLTLSKTSGKVSRIFPEEITLSVADAPCPGTTTAQFRIDASGLEGSGYVVTVTFVQRNPTLTIVAQTLSFAHECLVSPPPPQTIDITSDAVLPTGWTATVVGGDGWLTLDKQSGTVSDSSPDRIEVSITELASCPGTATAEIRIESPGLDGSPQSVTVTTEQSVRPILDLATRLLEFDHRCGAEPPSPQQIDIKSSSTTPAAWTATIVGGEDWLTLGKSSGTVSAATPDRIDVSIAETADCAPELTAQIVVTAPAFSGSPQSIGVLLTQHSAYDIFLPDVIKGRSRAGHVRAAALTYDRIVLITGVTEYLHLPPPDTFTVLRAGVWGDDLLHPRSDSYAMAHFARDAELQDGQAMTIVLSEALATIANVEHALQWVDEREDANTEVIIYFSGHGGKIPHIPAPDEADSRHEMLAVYDTNDTPQFSNYILDEWLDDRLAELDAESLVLITDACNSGGMQVSNPHRAVLAASREDQNSWETSEFEHGVFTHYMLQALADAASDTDQDGWLSVQELYDYAADLVFQYVQSNNGEAQNLSLDLTRDVRLLPMNTTGMHQ